MSFPTTPSACITPLATLRSYPFMLQRPPNNQSVLWKFAVSSRFFGLLIRKDLMLRIGNITTSFFSCSHLSRNLKKQHGSNARTQSGQISHIVSGQTVPPLFLLLPAQARRLEFLEILLPPILCVGNDEDKPTHNEIKQKHWVQHEQQASPLFWGHIFLKEIPRCLLESR